MHWPNQPRSGAAEELSQHPLVALLQHPQAGLIGVLGLCCNWLNEGKNSLDQVWKGNLQNIVVLELL